MNASDRMGQIIFGPRARRRGSAYIIVMSTVVLVSVAGVAGMMAAGAQRQAVERTVDIEKARLIAQAGLEVAAGQMRNTAAWRSGITGGVMYSDHAFAGGTFSVRVTDPVDGLPANNLTDDVLVISEGRFNDARQVYQRRFRANALGLDALEWAAHAGGNVSFAGCTLRAHGAVGCAGNAIATTANVHAEVDAGGTVSGSVYHQPTYGQTATLAVPNEHEVLAAYQAIATTIDRESLPGPANRIDLNGFVLAPGVNPFGTTNQSGVYLLDCDSQRVTVSGARVHGTLVLINPGEDSRIEDHVLMEAATPGYPALIVIGNITIAMSSVDLAETHNLNLNPSTAPYRGVSDTDILDRYPSMISGLVYASGTLRLEQQTTIYGPVLSGGDLIIADAPVLFAVSQTPAPPGFIRGNGFAPVSGAFTRIAD